MKDTGVVIQHRKAYYDPEYGPFKVEQKDKTKKPVSLRVAQEMGRISSRLTVTVAEILPDDVSFQKLEKLEKQFYKILREEAEVFTVGVKKAPSGE